MKSKHLKLIDKARGEMDAQLKKNYLLSKGIEAILYEESLGTLYGLTNTPLGEVEIYVKNADYEAAVLALKEIS
jgi:hypothetical protein